jgi:Zn-dependent protease with chaperone function
MKIVPKFFKCKRSVRFLVLFVIFSVFSASNLGEWENSFEFVVVSSLIPYSAYSAISVWRPSLLAFYYGTKEGKADPQLTSFARRVNPRINRVIIKDLNRPYAYANRLTNSIILSRKLVDTLSDQEVKAVIYHEIGHGGFPPLFQRALISVFMIPLLISLYGIVCLLAYGIIRLVYLFLDFSCFPFLLSFLFCVFFSVAEREMWNAEYKADVYSAKRTETSLVISALRKIVSPELADCDSPTHPSLKRRIAFLEEQE